MADNGDTVTLKKDTFYGVVIVVLLGLLILSIMTQGFGFVKTAPASGGTAAGSNTGASTGSGASGGTGSGSGGSQGGQAAQVTTLQIPQYLSKTPVLGTSTSGVTLLEFSDFQCPFCGMTWGKQYSAQYASIIGTVSKFKTDYVTTNKANIALMPVAFLGQESVNAGNAALCAGEQGSSLFWQMHDLIFNAQDTSENNGKYDNSKLKDMAKGLTGLDTAKFNSCVDAGTYVSQLDGFTQDWGTTVGANTPQNVGTPTFYILVDSAKVSKDKVSSASAKVGYTWGLSPDKKLYVILASPEYSKLKVVMDALLA